jgi:periplasmic divalent cation tolerance protein
MKMYAIVEVTTSGEDESKNIGKTVVSERLAACANIIPAVTSFYWWKGKLEEDSESILLLKTKKECLDRLISRVKELHSYENPAIISLPIEKGSETYLNWIFDEACG